MRTVRLSLFLLLAPALGPSAGAAIVADHNSVDASAIPDSAVAAAANLRVHLRRASVGGNISDGLDALKSANARYDRSRWVFYDRGNPGWQAKVDEFKTFVAANAASYDVLSMKFCFIDPDASFTYYRDALLGLEAAYPGKIFVWWTIPLQTSGNAARQSFNDQVRAYAKANNKPLFDIADIEAYDAAGSHVVDTGGIELQAAGWSSDGGHLNSTGGQRVASGWWWIMARLAGWNPGATPTLTINDTSIAEGHTGTKTATLTVRLSAASSTPVTVQFVAGTATGPGTGHICDPPIGLADVSNPTTVVGTGTPASCTEVALRAAVANGGVITFNCGPAPVTIGITQTIDLRNDVDTVIDGGGKVTLDAAKGARHFYFNSSNWMVNTATVTLQRLVMRNGKAPAGTYYPPDPTYPTCAYGYKEGSGGALYMRDGVLHVIDCEFYDNEAALLGPDVGGGALYLQGVRGVVIVNSRFKGNSAANGGAVGMLWANAGIYNSVFEDNTAVGVGMNYVEPACPKTFNHANQGGAGGLSGGVYFDGMDNDGLPYTICGSVFRNNRCNELGGALFRTPNVEVRQMVIDRSVFQGNTARGGGVSFIKQNDVTVRESLFAGNRGGRNVDGQEIGGWSGGLWVNESSLNLVNTTFNDNSPGGLSVELYGGATATVRNATFVDSESSPSVSAYSSVFVNVPCDTTSGTDNVQFPRSGSCPSDTIYADPKLAALADNGGPTQSMLPAMDSSVLGVGNGCPATDQRGRPRSASGCDAGAVER